MGSAQSQNISETQDIANQIMQKTSNVCVISTNNNFSGNTVITEGGDLSIDQVSSITSANCDMSSVLQQQLTNTLQETAKESASALSGLSFTFDDIDLTTNVAVTLRNSVTQLMDNTCNLTASNSVSNNYFFTKGGDSKFVQDSEISNGLCNMTNSAKSVIDNKVTQDAELKSSITSVFGILFIVIALILLLPIIIIVIKAVSGGGKKGEATDQVINLVG
jgi:hypothetical protein